MSQIASTNAYEATDFIKRPKNRLITKVIEVGLTTLASRLLGLLREILINKFLGGGLGADLFFTAYKIPNSLRKIFAEGALSAALVPNCVQLGHAEGKKAVSRLITLTLVIFQTILVVWCGIIFWQAEYVIRFIAPGWFIKEGVMYSSSAIPIIGKFFEWIAPAWYITTPMSLDIVPIILYIRILIGFIICISSSALFAAALQVANHFFIPAFSPVLLNVIYIGGLAGGLWFGCSVNLLCYLILIGGIIQAILHVAAYFWFNFSLDRPTSQTWHVFGKVLSKFIPCFLSMSILEINLFVSTSQATYLPSGSIAAIYYANRFMGIPLGVFAVALSTILLPYFSKIGCYAPRRLGFYLFESAKLIAWITIPLMLLLMFFSEKIFLTLFLSNKFTLMHVHSAAILLSGFATGLFFFSLNKILLNVFYALHETRLVSLLSILVAATNYGMGRLLSASYGAQGLVYAFVVAGIVQTVLLCSSLSIRYGIKLYINSFLDFFIRSMIQCFLISILFYSIYKLAECILFVTLPLGLATTLMQTYIVWLWTIPLIFACFVILWATRRFFGLKLVFLD